MDPLREKSDIRRLQEEFRARGNPRGWYDEVYRRADGQTANVPWLDLEPNPKLTDWLASHPATDATSRAAVVGCGLGDDAEALVARGYQVTAFDISRTATHWCRQRFPDTKVDYQTADLFTHPPSWHRRFQLVFECNTIQALPLEFRAEALRRIAELVAPGGRILVSCRSRAPGEKEDEIPVPLDRREIDGFCTAGLTEIHFEEYGDNQDPPVPHYFAVYRR